MTWGHFFPFRTNPASSKPKPKINSCTELQLHWVMRGTFQPPASWFIYFWHVWLMGSKNISMSTINGANDDGVSFFVWKGKVAPGEMHWNWKRLTPFFLKRTWELHLAAGFQCVPERLEGLNIEECIFNLFNSIVQHFDGLGHLDSNRDKLNTEMFLTYKS